MAGRSLSVGWLLAGDERVASSRLQGWMIDRGLRERGHLSSVLNAPGAFDTRLDWKAPRRWWVAIGVRRDVLIFQKVESSRAVALARLARRMGTRIVMAQADPRPSPMYDLADRVVVSSEELGRQLRALCPAPIEVIEDAIEHPPELAAPGSDRREGIRLLWVGHRFNYPALAPLRELLARPEWSDARLVTVSDHPEADHPWSPERVREELMRADVGVIPVEDTEPNRTKSVNRLILFMSVGLPVAASPLPAYSGVIASGRNGFLARSPEEWASALAALRDPEARRSVGRAARETAWARFAPERAVDRWEALLLGLARRPGSGTGAGPDARSSR